MLLTTAEVALRLRVTERTVMRWARTGVLPAVRPKGAREWRFRSQDIDELFQPSGDAA